MISGYMKLDFDKKMKEVPKYVFVVIQIQF